MKKKKLGSKKIIGPKNFGVQQNFWVQEILGHQKFWDPKNLGSVKDCPMNTTFKVWPKLNQL